MYTEDNDLDTFDHMKDFIIDTIMILIHEKGITDPTTELNELLKMTGLVDALKDQYNSLSNRHDEIRGYY